MQQWLQHLPSIPEFTIAVRDNDAAFNKDWWTTEITKKLPALKDTLTVDVYIEDGKEWKDLWMEDLPAEAGPRKIRPEVTSHFRGSRVPPKTALLAVSRDVGSVWGFRGSCRGCLIY
ncbi:hypothetical protein VTO73DRAFT_15112 [Trametes versicolor]